MNHVMYMFSHVQWIASMDVDEFIVPQQPSLYRSLNQQQLTGGTVHSHYNTRCYCSTYRAATTPINSVLLSHSVVSTRSSYHRSSSWSVVLPVDSVAAGFMLLLDVTCSTHRLRCEQSSTKLLLLANDATGTAQVGQVFLVILRDTVNGASSLAVVKNSGL